jgi:hypothetical protein
MASGKLFVAELTGCSKNPDNYYGADGREDG